MWGGGACGCIAECGFGVVCVSRGFVEFSAAFLELVARPGAGEPRRVTKLMVLALNVLAWSGAG